MSCRHQKNICLLKARQFKTTNLKSLFMVTPHLCFMLDCKNTIERHPHDFSKLYCLEHDEYNFTDASNYILGE